MLCIAVLVLGTLLALNPGILPELSQRMEETGEKLTNGTPQMPIIPEEVTTTTSQTAESTVHTTKATTRAALDAQECRELTLSMLETLSVDADEETLREARELLAELERGEGQEYYSLLSAVLSYADGRGDAKRLSEVIDKGDKKTVKQAAVSCWAAYRSGESKVTFSFAGDCTFAYFNESNRAKGFPAVYAASGSVTYPFDNVRGVFSADDMTTVNFEGVLSDSANHAEKQFYFRGKKEYAKILSSSSVESANLANNHTLDYYEKGFEDTVIALENEGVGVFWGSEPYVSTLRTDSGTMSVVMLSTSSIDIKNNSKFKEIKKQIERYKSPNTIVIVNLHWGVERAVKPSQWQIDTAHELADAGADLIVGHHPHVLQGIEKYKGVYIAYSLGNFAFGGNSSAKYPETVILRAEFDIDSGEVGECSIAAVPCYITSSGGTANDYKPSLQYGKKGEAVIRLVLERSALLENGITELDWHGIS